MAKYEITSNIDLGSDYGPIPWLNVVAPVGRGVLKNNKFAQIPTDAKGYINCEYNEMRQMAETLVESGKIDKDTPILYPERGGLIAAKAIADVTGGTIYPLQKDRSDGKEKFVLSDAGKEALGKAKHIVVADDVIHTGGAMRKTTAALKEMDYHGNVSFLTNRMLNKSLSKTIGGGRSGGVIGMFMPENAEIYTGGIYTGRDNTKTSAMLDWAIERGLKLETLATTAASSVCR